MQPSHLELATCFIKSVSGFLDTVFSFQAFQRQLPYAPLQPDGLPASFLQQVLQSARRRLLLRSLAVVQQETCCVIENFRFEQEGDYLATMALFESLPKICDALASCVDQAVADAYQSCLLVVSYFERDVGRLPRHSLYICSLCHQRVTTSAVKFGHLDDCTGRIVDIVCASRLITGSAAPTYIPDLLRGSRECPICEEERPRSSFVTLCTCGHLLCIVCACQYLQLFLSEHAGRWPPLCYRVSCSQPIVLGLVSVGASIATFFSDLIPEEFILTSASVVRFSELEVLSLVPAEDRLYCPCCCELLQLPDSESCIRTDDKASEMCPACGSSVCLTCGQSHAGEACPPAETELLNAVQRINGKACPHCGTLVVHYRDHGCHHILPGSGCPGCHGHFCFACLAPCWPCTTLGCAPWCGRHCDCIPCLECSPDIPCPACTTDGCASCARVGSKHNLI